MNEAYHQLELHPDSRYITTFHGTQGKMRYKRLNYGTISAQDIFDKAMDDVLQGINGVLHIRDDFIVYGATQQEHDDSLRKLLQRFQEYNLTFSKRKCKFNLSEVEFFGFIFSKDGMKPAPSKIIALKTMTPPKSASDVRSLLGMAQYSSQFIPGFSNLTAPLRALTLNNAKWKWGSEEQEAFTKLQNALTDDSVLGYYEVGQPTELRVDAGPHGLGAIIFQLKDQGWQPVFCASRSLTKTEERYSQLEREALAIRWACERCYVYLIGSVFTVITDHKPLLPIFSKHNSHPPICLERWLMYLQQFDFTLEYRPGKLNAADYLSRHPSQMGQREAQSINHREEKVKFLIQERVPGAITLEQLRTESINDPILKKLKNCITKGDIATCKKDPDLYPFYNIFQELSVAEDIILRGEVIVIPSKLRPDIIKLSHEGHQGIVKTKQFLRSRVWFPRIDSLVEREIKQCIPCQAATPRTTREPLKMSPLPKGPWVQVSADFCGPFPNGEMALVVIDEYSCYPDVEFCTSTSAKSVIPKFEKIFSTHGIPDIIKTDNGPPFNSKEFKDFAMFKGFSHRKITPLWPEANAQAENFMKTLQKAARTAHMEGKNWKCDIYNFLLNYRATPYSSIGKSPFQMCMNRTVQITSNLFHCSVHQL
jgi:hypothetical protein